MDQCRISECVLTHIVFIDETVGLAVVDSVIARIGAKAQLFLTTVRAIRIVFIEPAIIVIVHAVVAILSSLCDLEIYVDDLRFLVGDGGQRGLREHPFSFGVAVDRHRKWGGVVAEP